VLLGKWQQCIVHLGCRGLAGFRQVAAIACQQPLCEPDRVVTTW
jgi:hypothetical protein